MEREVRFEEIKNIFKKKVKPDKRTDELSELLDEKAFTAEKTTTNTIDIPIVTEEMSENYKMQKSQKNQEESEINAFFQNRDRVSAPVPAEKVSVPEESERHIIDLDKGEENKPVHGMKHYNFPPIDFLKEGNAASKRADSEVEMQETALKLVQTLENFGVKTSLVDVHRGPTVTRYELQPSPGVKISRITGLADDIALNLARPDLP